MMLKKLWRLILRLFNFKDKEAKVPQGLEVRDSVGDIISTTDSRLSILVSKIPITGTDKTYTVYSSLFLTNDVFVIAPQVPHVQTLNPVTFNHVLSGDKLTITTNNIKYDPVSPSSILVGVY